MLYYRTERIKEIVDAIESEKRALRSELRQIKLRLESNPIQQTITAFLAAPVMKVLAGTCPIDLKLPKGYLISEYEGQEEGVLVARYIDNYSFLLMPDTTCAEGKTIETASSVLNILKGMVSTYESFLEREWGLKFLQDVTVLSPTLMPDHIKLEDDLSFVIDDIITMSYRTKFTEQVKLLDHLETTLIGERNNAQFLN